MQTMDSQHSWPQSDILSKCFILVRWLHEHGIAWSGTPPELSLHVSTYCEGTPFFRNGDELVKFIQINADMLRDLGLDSKVESVAGRTVVDLKITNPGISAEPRTPTDVASQLAAIEASMVRQQSLSSVSEPPGAEASLIPHQTPEQLANRLNGSTGSLSESALRSSNVDESAAKVVAVRTTAQSNASRKFSIPILIGIVLVAAALIYAFARPRSTSSSAPTAASTTAPAQKTETPPAASTATTEKTQPTQAPPVAVTTPPAQVAPAPVAAPAVEKENPSAEKLDPAERKNFEAVYEQASGSRTPSAQYDLGMRYAQGIGVPKDSASAYAWLTLADTNGSLEADSALQTLTSRLSADELQRARVYIANAYIAGVVVPKNYVSAYRLLLQAERAGSADAVTIKKELEVRMPVWQIVQAGGQPPVRDPNKK